MTRLWALARLLRTRKITELRFRAVHGYWCTHEAHSWVQRGGHVQRNLSGFTPWRFANEGRNKYRRCLTCRRWEWA